MSLNLTPQKRNLNSVQICAEVAARATAMTVAMNQAIAIAIATNLDMARV